MQCTHNKKRTPFSLSSTKKPKASRDDAGLGLSPQALAQSNTSIEIWNGLIYLKGSNQVDVDILKGVTTKKLYQKISS